MITITAYIIVAGTLIPILCNIISGPTETVNKTVAGLILLSLIEIGLHTLGWV